MLTPETLDRLESQAARQIGKEMSTPIAVNPGDLRELIACYRISRESLETTQAKPASVDSQPLEQTT